MAIDVLAKRMAMLTWATGPASYALLVRSTKSGLSVQEKYALLKLYAGFARCLVSGTAIPSLTDGEVVAGGETIILTLINDTWITEPNFSLFARVPILRGPGLDSAQSEVTGWDAEVKAKEVAGAVVRTSNTVVTITLSAAAAYSITANETITSWSPALAMLGTAYNFQAEPMFMVKLDTGVNPWRFRVRRHRI